MVSLKQSFVFALFASCAGLAGPAAVGAEEAGGVRSPFPQWRVWEQADANGDVVPHYAISTDGGETFSPPRATSYRLMLRYAEFEPRTDAAPAVDDALAADLDTSLYVVQFHTQPLESFREQIRAFGASVHAYLPRHAHVVRMNPATRVVVEAMPFVRWVGPFHPAYKLDESILAAHARGVDPGPQHYSIQVFERGLGQQRVVADRIAALGGSVMNTAVDGFRMTVTVTLDQVLDLARLDAVHFIDPWGPGETDMDVVRQIGGAVPLLSGLGITGQGVRGEIFDTEVSANHPEWDGQTPLYHGPDGNAGTHGSSCYGICFSTGVGNATATGLLPDREQGIFSFYANSTQFGGPTTRLTQNTEATDPSGPYRSVFQTSSVGSPRTTEYTTISAETDDYLFQVDYLSCQSMSNANLVPQTRPQAWAKNIVAVGGITHHNTLSRADDNSAGSTGPAADGRIKPELAHFYDLIFTTTSGSSYTQFGGTSGATPCTCGHLGLLMQMWHEQVFAGFGGAATVFESRMKSTTAKALAVNTAHRYDWTNGGANGNMTRDRQGWGMVDLDELYDYRDRIFIVDETDVLPVLGSTSYAIDVAAGEPVLRVTMTYLDPAGNPGASMHRINDLDLKVTAPSGTVYWGNNGLRAGNFSTAGGVPNELDTTENVFVENPAAGTWTVDVIAAEINEDSHLETPAVDADYALVVTGVQGAEPVGACCVAAVCSIETETGCAAAGGVWQGAGTTCSPDPCSGAVVNLATADFATSQGTITSGSFIETHASDDVYEAIEETHTGGPPSRRRSQLDHVWTFDVAAGLSYAFNVEAHHTANAEGDDFVFSYSRDDVSYTSMVTVTKTADDDTAQSYAFLEDVSGTLYVRVEDLDRTQGNGVRDTIFVDAMEVVTTTLGNDETPPSAPTGLVATPGDAVVGLDWDDNGEPDLDGYNVHRAIIFGGPYTQLNAGLLPTSDYTDNAVTNGTTYFYVVTAVDTSGNESVYSDEVVATPNAGGGATTLHVAQIVAGLQKVSGGDKLGRAEITIVDDLGDPVADADVTGIFTGDYDETVTAATGADGVAVLLTTGTARGGVSYTVCVDDVTHATLSYNEAGNVVTCGSR